jgi:CubicO group peptidase (beta-lactamase class C family)
MMNKIKKIIILLIVVIAVITALNWEKINRLHTVITLFDQERIIDNFSHMDQAFITQPILKPSKTHRFKQANQNLPKKFNYQGESLIVDDFLKRRATTALIVIKNDEVTFEQYYLGTTRADKRISWSMAKSFVSVLFGMQVDAGKIDIEQPVDFYLPEMQGSGYENVKVKHVLQMSSGVKWDEDYQNFNSDINKMGRVLAVNGSLDEMTTELQAESEPGKAFHYVSMDTHVIGMIVRQVSGKSLVELLQERIWNKLGMESDAAWITDSQGVAFALGGLNVIARDYARFGLLLLNNGQWQGEQLVSKEWISEATTAQSDYLKSANNKLGYGYQIWLPPEAESGEFFCVGVYGQYIYVNQQENIVIVKNSADKNFQDKLNSKQETIAFFRAIVASLHTASSL